MMADPAVRKLPARRKSHHKMIPVHMIGKQPGAGMLAQRGNNA